MKIKIHPMFILFLAISAVMGNFVIVLNYLTVVVLHEFAHAFMARHLGYTLNTLTMLPQGAQISMHQNFKTPKHEILTAIAGPLCNLGLFVLTVAFWWILPESYAITETFAFCNLITALFNLLPIMPLDGGRICLAIFGCYKKRKAGQTFCNVFAVFASLALLGVFIYSIFISINFTYLIMSIFLIVPMLISNESCVYINFEESVKTIIKKNKTGKTNAFVVLSSQKLGKILKHMSKNKYNICYVVDDVSGDVVANFFEGEIYRLLENNKLSKKICEIID